ncbi:MAG: hypothetical protein EU531_00805 [Promethearchaeota archaeon]|nr:MAG: hypothetical protein EU531_00805 [Candidatus Lokiarchaeota archaeon]
MTFAIKFEEDAIRDIQRDYIQVKCSPFQLFLIKRISEAICEQIDIPMLTIRAATWYTLKEWQLRNNRTIAEVNCSDIKSKIIAGKEIFDIGKHILKQFLKEPSVENEMKLDIAYEKAFKIYLNVINEVTS